MPSPITFRPDGQSEQNINQIIRFLKDVHGVNFNQSDAIRYALALAANKTRELQERNQKDPA